MKGLILAGGMGSRLRPITYAMPKHLVPLMGKAMIEYPIEHLVEIGIRDIGIVVGYLGELIREYLGDGSRYGSRFHYIRQEERKGIAHAIHLSIVEGFIDESFIVYLGDNILSKGLRKYSRIIVEEDPDVFILLARVRDPSRFGVAVLEDGRIINIIEKPKEFVSDLAVIGVYYFRDPDLVERAYSTLKPSWRGEYEITELIKWFIDHGYNVRYEITDGWWKDVGTPEGLLEALYLLLDSTPSRIEGEVSGEITGRVVVEKGAIVEGKVYGPAYIGPNAYIGENAIVEHYSSVERSVRVVSGKIARSLIMDDTIVDIGSLRLIESVVGRNSLVKSTRELHGDIKLEVSNFSKIII